VIRFERVSKGFGPLVLFEGLDLEVRRGEVLALLGPSGCGKTTLLDLAAGLLNPDDGRIEAPRTRSYVFQEPRLLPWESVLENAAYAMDPAIPRTDRMERARAMLEVFELTEAADKRPDEISGGMARRTALARALLAPHDVLLLDEPFSSLDPSLRGRIIDRTAPRITESAVILVTHDHAAASRLADRILLLSPPPVRMHSLDRADLAGAIAEIEAAEQSSSRSYE